MTPSGEALAARVLRLRREVTDHKSVIRRRRELLALAKAALDALEAECRERGIALVIVPTPGAGARFHGHPDDDPVS